MISRKSTNLIADAYAAHFKALTGVSTYGQQSFPLKDNEAYNFLYEREYEVAFLQVMAKHIQGQNTLTLNKALMGIHTGETLAPAMTNSSYKERQKLGQPFLKKLAEDLIRHYEETPVRQIAPQMRLTPQSGSHDLRHTFGTRLADAGVDVVKIKELMGHASIVTTMRYIHATDQGKRGAITVLSEYRQKRRHKFVTDEKRQAVKPAVSH